MIDEHFGITVVEFMVSRLSGPSTSRHASVRHRFAEAYSPCDHFLQAAGLIPLAHSSAGPLLDIVVPYDDLPTGFHATSPDTFASQLATILALEPEAKVAMRERARKNATERFSEAVFEEGWMTSWRKLKALGEGEDTDGER